LALIGCTRAVTSAAPACSDMQWSIPDTLGGPGDTRIYVETPEILRHGDRLLLFGSPAFASDSGGRLVLPPGTETGVPLFAGIQIPLRRQRNGRAEGTLIPLPAGAMEMRTVRAALDTTGDIGILYKDRPPQGDSSSRYATVWAAALHRGAWTTPKVVIRAGEGVDWLAGRISTVAGVGDANLLSATLPTRDSLKLVRFEAGRWTVRTVAFPSHVYSTIASLPGPDSALVLAYVTSGERHRENELFVNRSLDGGRTWGSPVTITHNDSPPAHFSHLVRSGGTIALVWLEQAAKGDSVSRLHLAWSSDRATSWHEAPSVAVGAMPSTLRAVADGAGRVHVVVDGASGDIVAPRHFAWDGTAWQESAPPGLKGAVVPSPNIAALGRDSLVMVWSLVNRRGLAPISLMSVGHLACAR
jgi:hypothetical protein